MKRDLKDNIDVVVAYAATNWASTGTGSAVDLTGYDSAVAVFTAGTMGATGTGVVPSLTESADGTTYTAVGTGDLQGAFASHGTGVASVVQRVGYIGTARYIKPVLTGLGGTGAGVGTPVAMVVVRGHPNRSPLS